MNGIGFNLTAIQATIAVHAASASGITFGSAASSRATLPERATEEPVILHAFTAQMSVLPDMLTPKHGPLLVVIETWSDGVVVARWPEGRLYGEADNDSDAIRSLADNLGEFVANIVEIQKTHPLGGAALEQWRAITAMFNVVEP